MTTEIEAEIAAMRATNNEWFASAERVLKSRDELLAAAKGVLHAWESGSGMGTLYSMTRAISSIRTAIANAERKSNAPYGEMCLDPQACSEKGYCPRDPTCGD